MKIQLLFIYCLLSLTSQAVSKDSNQLFWYEGNVLSVSTRSLRVSELLSGYENIPTYINDYSTGYSTQFFRQDTLKNQYSYETFPSAYIDYRSNVIGVQRNIKNRKRLSLNHSFALSISRADFKYWGELKSYFSSNQLTFDSAGNNTSAYIVSRYVDGYKKQRRVGVTYQNSVNLKIAKWLRLDVALRHSFHLKYKDDLYLKEHVYMDTAEYSYVDNDRNYVLADGDRRNRLSLRGISLYDKEQPGEGYSTHKGKTTIQYDAFLLIKPTIILGKEKHLEIYVSAGPALGTIYGPHFWAGQRGIVYGCGVGYRL